MQSRLIGIISKASDKEGDLLLDFMDKYGLYRLQDATIAQLEEYIANHHLKEGEQNSARKEF